MKNIFLVFSLFFAALSSEARQHLFEKEAQCFKALCQADIVCRSNPESYPDSYWTVPSIEIYSKFGDLSPFYPFEVILTRDGLYAINPQDIKTSPKKEGIALVQALEAVTSLYSYDGTMVERPKTSPFSLSLNQMRLTERQKTSTDSKSFQYKFSSPI